MNDEQGTKVKAGHRARDAYVYVRQATHGRGSQDAGGLLSQYNLWQQVVALGWPAECVSVIDCDIGQSGLSTADRRGFQELVRQVQGGRVGVVVAQEPSRLTRNFTDWRRLLEACRTSTTLLLIQDQLYDPADTEDQVLLGCEWTMPVRTTMEATP